MDTTLKTHPLDRLTAEDIRSAGADLLVVQGAEAGGHRGGFDDAPERAAGLLPRTARP